jgi:hypothetical protein
MYPKSIILILFLSCTAVIHAQTATEKKPTEAEEKLRNEAVAFFSETHIDVKGNR